MMQLASNLLARVAMCCRSPAVRVGLLCQLALLLLPVPAAQADTRIFGDYTVHYIAVNSTFISPEIAAQFSSPSTTSSATAAAPSSILPC
ncbi:MAG: DUF4426 domain-containing protein [Pseudohongiellaceae bacterium]